MSGSLIHCLSPREKIETLRSTQVVILPSLLQCDFGHLADDLQRIEAAGVEALHLDVMDGHFVPNLSYGLTLVEAIRKLTSLPLDLHLMIANPAEYVQRYREAGADLITIHAEAVDQPREVLAHIRDLGAVAGLAINPPTPVESIDDCLDLCDLVLVMSVMPGFGGQAFDPVALDKLKFLRNRVADHVVLEVDGGVNRSTIAACAEAGANWFVVGSAIFGQDDYKQEVSALTELARLTKSTEQQRES